jgi:hypothetical protein
MQIGTFTHFIGQVDRPLLLRTRSTLQSRIRLFAARRFRRPIHWRTVYKPPAASRGYIDPLARQRGTSMVGVHAQAVRSWNPWRAILAWFRLLRVTQVVKEGSR